MTKINFDGFLLFVGAVLLAFLIGYQMGYNMGYNVIPFDRGIEYVEVHA